MDEDLENLVIIWYPFERFDKESWFLSLICKGFEKFDNVWNDF